MRGIIIFTIIILFSSCSGGGDDIDPFLYLKSTELELVCEDTDTLVVETAGIEMLKWETDNDFSITVDNNGIVNAIRVGETIVTVKDIGSELQAKCNITVSPKYFTYTEPPLVFGSSQEEFKEEMEKLSDYSYRLGNDIFLNYDTGSDSDINTNITMLVSMFNENKLMSIIITLSKIDNVLKFLSERYKKISQTGDGDTEPIIYSFINKEGDLSIIYKEEPSKVGSTITYSPVEKTEQ